MQTFTVRADDGAEETIVVTPGPRKPAPTPEDPQAMAHGKPGLRTASGKRVNAGANGEYTIEGKLFRSDGSEQL